MDIDAEKMNVPDRFKKYVEVLKQLLKNHDVSNPKDLVRAIKANDEFKKEWLEVWREIANQDGGKMSLTTAGAIIGATLGGVGIAGAWGAFGLPLFAVLGLAGFVAGSKIDSKAIKVKLPKKLYEEIEKEAASRYIGMDELISEKLIDIYDNADTADS